MTKKQRKFWIKQDSQNIDRLAQCTEVKDGGKSEMSLPIVYADEFFSTIHEVHIDVSSHCGINKTEYAINIRFALTPWCVIAKYCSVCSICSRTTDKFYNRQ